MAKRKSKIVAVQPALFKVLVDGKSCHGGDTVYVPGKWTPKVSPVCCAAGYHLTNDPLKWWKSGAEVWLAEGQGTLDAQGDDKGAFDPCESRSSSISIGRWRRCSRESGRS